MATCPECDAEIEIDEFDVDKGDLISCPECGTNLEVTTTSPVELEAVDDEEEDDDDDDDEKEEDDADDVDDLDEDDDDEVDDEETGGGLGRVTPAPTAWGAGGRPDVAPAAHTVDASERHAGLIPTRTN